MVVFSSFTLICGFGTLCQTPQMADEVTPLSLGSPPDPLDISFPSYPSPDVTPPKLSANNNPPAPQQLPSFYFENYPPQIYALPSGALLAGYPAAHTPTNTPQLNSQYWNARQQQAAMQRRGRGAPGWFCGGWGCFRPDPRGQAQGSGNRPTTRAPPPAVPTIGVPPSVGEKIDTKTYPTPIGPFVGEMDIAMKGRKTLVLDLDETLVHSAFQPGIETTFVIPVELDGNSRNIFVGKRPGVDQFLRYAAEHFEVVIFTASLAKYANPLLDKLDPKGVLFRYRLFRDSCSMLNNGVLVKDLSKIGRPLGDLIIMDNSPTAYSLQKENAFPVKTWVNDPYDNALLDSIPILESIRKSNDVRVKLESALEKWGQERGENDVYNTLMPVLYY